MGRKKVLFAVIPVAIVVLMAGLSAGRAGAANGAVSIVYPPDNVFVTQEQIEVVGLAKGQAVKNLKVAVKGGKVLGGSSVPVVKGAFAFSVQLRPGMNHITVTDSAGGEAQSSISVYLLTEKTRKRLPKDFTEYKLHSKLEEKHECGECHNLRGAVPSYKRMKRSATCMTSQCHQNMGKAEFVHGPVAGGMCVACHNPHGSKNENHRARTGAEECYVCHENKKEDFAKAHMHKPVEKGSCIECHDPHQSDTKFQLKAASVQDLCFSCHDGKMFDTKYVHGPVAAGGCVVCHNPHASENSRLLVRDHKKGVLCFMCHEARKAEFERKHTHKPVTETCLHCHHPHGSLNPFMLKKQQKDLCLGCHEKLHPEVADQIKTAEVQHPPVAEGKCVACHTPHSTDFEKQLKATMQTICYTCHVEKGEAIRSAKFPHGPVKNNDCIACHMPHGSNNTRILRKYFPPEFYTPYATEKYAICFDCHNKKIALDKMTTTLTNFRNGNVNLHFVHVNKDPKGRSCKACHEVHAGDQEKHIREEVPFGSMWSYPINYTKLETGGKCVVGCHKPRGYDRIKPVQN